MGNWDNEIDRIARHITDGEPAANFTAQVLARIDGLNARRRRRIAWMGTAAALAAATAMVFVIARPPWKADSGRPTSKTSEAAHGHPVASSRAAAAVPQDGADVAEANRPGPSFVPTAAGTSRPTAPAKSHEGSYGASGVNGAGAAIVRAGNSSAETGPLIAADRVDRLQLAPIHVEPLTIDPMETVDAIRVPALDIAPLELPRFAVALLDVPALGGESFEGRVQ